MATAADAAQHREVVEDIVALAMAELVSEWSGLDLDNPELMRKVFAELLDDLTETFAAAAAALGADWYDDMREQAGVPGSFVAQMPDLPSFDQIQSSASYAASGLYVSPEKALDDMAAITERIIANADRAAIEASVQGDPAEPRWARVARADACAFCAVLATRGPAYRGESTAMFAAHGSRYHEHCGCVATPVWPDEPFELPDYASRWVDAYDQVRAEAGPGSSFTDLLARMRVAGDLR